MCDDVPLAVTLASGGWWLRRLSAEWLWLLVVALDRPLLLLVASGPWAARAAGGWRPGRPGPGPGSGGRGGLGLGLGKLLLLGNKP
jgi:hypothetical protein